MRLAIRWVVAGIVGVTGSIARPGPRPNLQGNVARQGHYRAEGGGFVVVGGTDSFNRPMYGGNAGFRVDGGDREEFSLFLPGRGGVVRIGTLHAGHGQWLSDMLGVKTTYIEGRLEYEAGEGDRTIKTTALPLARGEGLLLRIEVGKAEPGTELVLAYGGINGEKGSRNGDIGTEKVPVAEFWAMKPGQCVGNRVEVAGDGFVLEGKGGRVRGIVPAGMTGGVGDARQWGDVAGLVGSVGKETETPVVVERVGMDSGQIVYVALVSEKGGQAPNEQVGRAGEGAAKQEIARENLERTFMTSEEYYRGIARRVEVETPEPWVNSAVSALCVAENGVWDEKQGVFMHGAVAWRVPMLGWRGAYAGDALGEHEQTRRHLEHWLERQNRGPVPAELHGPDEESNLARCEWDLHTNGDLSNNHYDMNLVGIDALFRHLMWTGDVAYARKRWPEIVRHLAWERRLFRRTYGQNADPLYEAYCCIWASDDMQYNGGGAAYSSAYNYFENAMAARVAAIIGEDPTPYRQEAEAILRGMRRQLWLKDRGWFAEYRDPETGGNVHPAAGVWTHYTVIDEGVPDERQAWEMGRYVDSEIAHIPVRGPGLPEGGYTLATSKWMPYTWSVNNVVMAETVHTALADWEAGRSAEAFAEFKGAVLDSMYLGECPGNVGMCTHYDVYRGESQRDFADGVGTMARAVVEGLFGVRPDALEGVLSVQPGWPGEWEKASIRHKDFSLAYRREGETERYSIDSRFPRDMQLKLRLAARGTEVGRVRVNGREARWRACPEAVGRPEIEIDAAPTPKWEVEVEWKGARPVAMPGEVKGRSGAVVEVTTGGAAVERLEDPEAVLASAEAKGDRVRGVVRGVEGHRSVFARVKQGAMEWWMPVRVEVDAAPAPAAFDWRTDRSGAKFETVDLAAVFNDRVSQIFQHEYLAPRSKGASLELPKQGVGGWCTYKEHPAIDDAGLRDAAGSSGGVYPLPDGVPFRTPGPGEAKNVAFVSKWENFPREVTVGLSGKGERAYLLVAGSTNAMESRLANAEVVVEYADGTQEAKELRNPEEWWPIEQDYLVDDFGFERQGGATMRVDLKTGQARIVERGDGRQVEGGAATVVEMELDPAKELEGLTWRVRAKEVVAGLMAVTVER